MYFKGQLLKYGLLASVLISSCTNKIEEELQTVTEDMLPTFTVTETEFLRGTSSLELNVTNENVDLLTIEDIKLLSGDQELDAVVTQEDNKWQFTFDSKQLKDGIQDITLTSELVSDLTLPQNSLSINAEIEVDNYLPPVFFEQGYVESLNKESVRMIGSTKYPGKGIEVKTQYTDRFIGYTFTDEDGKVLSEYYNASTNNDSIKFLIPEDNRNRHFYLKEAISYEEDITSTELFDNSITKSLKSSRKVYFTAINSNIETPLTNTIATSNSDVENTPTKRVIVGLEKELKDQINISCGYKNGEEIKQETVDDITYYSIPLPVENISRDNQYNRVFTFSGQTRGYTTEEEAKGFNILTDFMNDNDTIIVTMDDLNPPYKITFDTDESKYIYFEALVTIGENKLLYYPHFTTVITSTEMKHYCFNNINVSDNDIKFITENLEYFEGGYSLLVNHLDGLDISNSKFINESDINISQTADLVSLSRPLFTDINVEMNLNKQSSQQINDKQYSYIEKYTSNSDLDRVLTNVDVIDEQILTLNNAAFTSIQTLESHQFNILYNSMNARLEDGHFWIIKNYSPSSNSRINGPYTIKEMIAIERKNVALEQAYKQGMVLTDIK